MSAAIVKAAAIAAMCLASAAAWAQTSGDSQSERGMPAATGAVPAKSERAMPEQTKDAGTPPPSAERAMPTPDKK